jgi:phosphoribosylformimino-5-aminoimidazole carboxamide ribotide isomerase
MKFRPCIDIHNGKVKQIIGGTLIDMGNQAKENFVSDYDGAFYAKLYKESGLTGGHIILLNPEDSEYYAADVQQAELALKAYPQGLQIGGGMNSSNAKRFLAMGASHVIVTSYVFHNGNIDYNHLNELVDAIGKDHIVLDLSCRKRDGKYYIVTNRWQTFTDVIVTESLLEELSHYCDEFLIHAVDVEGKASGIETELVALLGNWNGCPITYAGGVSSLKDITLLKELGKNHIDVTIGSALDLFGGKLPFQRVLDVIQ